MKVHVSLDPWSYAEKPKGNEIGGIRIRCRDNWKQMELGQVAELVGNQGHAMTPGHMVGGLSAENCTEMELFASDFDHGSSFAEVKLKCDRIGLPIAFAYHTYSSSEAEERFRVVFVHNCLIDDLFVIKVALAMLAKIFPECDKACKNTDRLFLGGKQLIYVDDREESRYSLVKLLLPFYEALSGQGHLARNVEAFCNTNNVLNTENRLAFYPLCYYSTFEHENGEIMDTAIKHIIAQSTESPFFILENKSQNKSKVHSSKTCSKKGKRLNVRDTCSCQLLNDFNSGCDMSHHAKFAILLNLLQINGGKAHFFRILERYSDKETVQKWERDAKYTTNYQAMRCSADFCPYYGQCEQFGTIVQTLAMDRKVQRDEEHLSFAGEAEEVLRENLEKAICSPARGFHLIRAQTAMGKTEEYGKLIASHTEQKFLIAVPTNQLKGEVYDRLTRKMMLPKESVFMTPSVQGNSAVPKELQDEISECHEKGFHKKTKEILREYYKRIKDNPDKKDSIEKLEELMADKTEALKGKRVIVTTHAYFSQMKEEVLKEYCIIIDEDILYLDYLNRVHRISENTLKQIGKKNIHGFSEIAAEILDTRPDYYKKLPPFFGGEELTEEQIEQYGLYADPDNNINDLLSARAFVRMQDAYSREKVALYYCPPSLPPLKYIVLSATLNADIYRRYFGKSVKCIEYDECKAVYKGRVVQYTYHSLGRSDLDRKRPVFDLAREISGNPDIPIITFKMFESEAGKNCRGMHFGNTAGLDELKGKDIAVIGTPFKRPEAYKLPACYLGADVNRKDDKRPVPMRVKYKGCSFIITTYHEEWLRLIQLHSLESELEQAVGRARALRFDCTVYVFSAFPCEQAELRTGKYLFDPAGDEEAKGGCQVAA